jgi:glycosyltransferase involved in cell wall biosynthesis
VKRQQARVCIIIPAYNEAAVIESVLKDAQKTFKTSPHDISIVVINDCSKDDTSARAIKTRVTVIDHVLNMGAGGATATGLRYAEKNGFDVAVTMDADGQHDSGDVLKGINHLMKTKSDLLIGSRLIDSTGMSRVKVLGNRGLSFITLVLFGIRSTDSQSGLRVFSKNALDHLYWKASGYEFASEMLWRARQLGLVTDEFPIKAIYTDYSKSKGQSNWNAINIVKSLFKERIVEMFE